MIRVDFRHHHGHVRCPSMSAVIGYHRCFRSGIFLFYFLDFFLCHVHGAKYEINLCRYFIHFVYIHHRNTLYGFRHGRGHFPPAPHCLFICPACGPGACRYCSRLKPRVIFQKRYESLPHHACSA